ncbi:uncharacterized protein LAESUDRAFT_743806 [Laetiporus sulphureus 93-53]|uniref:Mediator of RNA polymerase II transcription subunit 20 n=1 Tax=Laetiporus sulphureus 93-53 TaxID=1314785 RepID=A0A165DS95_9APHY|nr:uncharacterized protein LAESUDRAFT_743806 [Laetiporus sulphureus 93-53]KZT05525.1 hypothetical protein LAESUDRAFT_743806 [Laetiporus sulphureus 93-53]
MGIIGLARWINAPTTGVNKIRENLEANHQGVQRGRWILSLGSYRSTLSTSPAMRIPERVMYTVTMGDNVFVVLEDPTSPTRAELAQAASDSQPGQSSPTPPPHWRNTLVTVSPPGALEQLLGQLRARWVSVRQPGASSAGQRSQGIGMAQQQLTIDGYIYSIGNDWLVRFGHVKLAGGAPKGMLIEVEYLPLPVLQTIAVDGASELLANILISMLPMTPDAKIVGVNVEDAIWEEVLGGLDDDVDDEVEKSEEDADGDIFVLPDVMPKPRKGDWIGMDRDRRSAYMIVGALRQEGLI